MYKRLFFLPVVMFLNFANASDYSLLNQANSTIASTIGSSPVTFSKSGKVLFDPSEYSVESGGDIYIGKKKSKAGVPYSSLTIGKNTSGQIDKVFAVDNSTVHPDYTRMTLTKFNDSEEVSEVVYCDSFNPCIKVNASICHKITAAEKEMNTRFKDNKTLKDRIEECGAVIGNLKDTESTQVAPSDLSYVKSKSKLLANMPGTREPLAANLFAFTVMLDICKQTQFSRQTPPSQQPSKKSTTRTSGQ